MFINRTNCKRKDPLGPNITVIIKRYLGTKQQSLGDKLKVVLKDFFVVKAMTHSYTDLYSISLPVAKEAESNYSEEIENKNLDQYCKELENRSSGWIEKIKKAYSYFTIKNIEEMKNEKSSNSMLIAAPGPGITDYIKFYHEKDKHDQLALSYGALVLPESKFLWIEAFTYGGEPTNYKEWCSSLRECDAIINCHLFHVIGKRNFQENAKKFLLMTPMYEPVFPMPNIPLNPTIVLFYGENWRSKDSAKLIIQTYIDREYYKKALLNLRGSMLEHISRIFYGL